MVSGRRQCAIFRQRRLEAAICGFKQRLQESSLRPPAQSNLFDLFLKAPQPGQDFIEMDLMVRKLGRRLSLVALQAGVLLLAATFSTWV